MMPWKTCNQMDSKLNFVGDYARGGLTFSELCRRHQISRHCGYKWLRRYEQLGEVGLEEQSRRPHHSPRCSSSELEDRVVRIRKAHPVWGGRKIRKVLCNEGFTGKLPAASTISNILKRHGLLGSGTREGSPDLQRFERSESNDLWQMDFKGWIHLDNGKRCYPLTVLDDHSRYNLVLEACRAETEVVVKTCLTIAFERYGLPRQILCDHGNPWGKGLGSDVRQVGDTSLEVWLIRLGIEVIHGRVRHPQTQGKEERFHRTLKAEVLDRERRWTDLTHCQKAFEWWQRIYNEKRPHEALDLETPSSRYQLSHRQYPKSLAPIESFYLEEDVIRTVKTKGEITFKNHFFYIGRAYIGFLVALRQKGTYQWDVFYAWKQLGTIDINNTSKLKGRYHSIKQKV